MKVHFRPILHFHPLLDPGESSFLAIFALSPEGPHAIRSEATARQHRGGREERCDDWEPPGDSEAAAGYAPWGAAAKQLGGESPWGHAKAPPGMGGARVVPVGHDPTTP